VSVRTKSRRSETLTLRRILRVIAAKGLGMGLGVGFAVAMANVFGATASTDAFFLARRVVSNLSSVLERTFQILLVPGLVRVAGSGGLPELRRCLRRARWRVLAAAVVGCLALVLVAPALVRAIAPGFDEEQVAEASFFLRLLLIGLPIAATTATTGAMLNALRIFAMPVAARLAPRACVVAVLVVLPAGFGLDVVVLAWLTGTGLMAVIFAVTATRAFARTEQVPTVSDTGLDADDAPPGADAASPGTRRRRIAGMLVIQAYMIAASWVDMAFASATGAGGIVILEFGQRLVNMAPGLLTTSVITVYYTEFAWALVQQDQPTFRHLIGESIRTSLLFVAPLATVVFLLADGLVTVLFAHGAFTIAAAAATTTVVMVLAPLLLVTTVLATLTATVFADRTLPQLRLMVISAVVAMTCRVVWDLWAVPRMGLTAVPIGAFIATSALLVALYAMLNAHLGTLLGFAQLAGIARILLAAGLAGLSIVGFDATIAWSPGRLGELVRLAVLASAGAAVFAAAAAALNVPEVRRGWTKGIALVGLSSRRPGRG